MGDVFAIVIFVAAIYYCVLTFRVGKWYWRRSRTYSPTAKFAGRLAVMPAAWGIGAIGVEGFGMFAPIVPSTIFQFFTPDPYWHAIGLYWLANIAIVFVICILVLVRDLRRKDPVV